jgi:hypothetical protein
VQLASARRLVAVAQFFRGQLAFADGSYTMSCRRSARSAASRSRAALTDPGRVAARPAVIQVRSRADTGTPARSANAWIAAASSGVSRTATGTDRFGLVAVAPAGIGSSMVASASAAAAAITSAVVSLVACPFPVDPLVGGVRPPAVRAPPAASVPRNQDHHQHRPGGGRVPPTTGRRARTVFSDPDQTAVRRDRSEPPSPAPPSPDGRPACGPHRRSNRQSPLTVYNCKRCSAIAGTRGAGLSRSGRPWTPTSPRRAGVSTSVSSLDRRSCTRRAVLGRPAGSAPNVPIRVARRRRHSDVPAVAVTDEGPMCPGPAPVRVG